MLILYSFVDFKVMCTFIQVQLFTQQQWWDFLLFLVHLCLKCFFYVQSSRKINNLDLLRLEVGSLRFPEVFMTELEPGPRSNSLCTGAPSPKNKVWERDICGTQLTFAQHRHLLRLNFFEGRWHLYSGYRSSSAPISYMAGNLCNWAMSPMQDMPKHFLHWQEVEMERKGEGWIK